LCSRRLEREKAARKRAGKAKKGVGRDGLTSREQTELAAAMDLARQQREELLRRAGASHAPADLPSALGDAAASAPSSSALMASDSGRARSSSLHEGQTEALTLLARMPPAAREALRDARVIQRSLVYVTGLAPLFAKTEVLSRKDFFGQYGKVIKVVVNRTNLAASGGRPPSASAYITFDQEDNAATAVRSVSGHKLEGRVLK